MMFLIRPVLRDISLVGAKDYINEFRDDSFSIDDFIMAAVADISDKDSPGADCFYFRILTPKRLNMLLTIDKILFGRAVYVVNEKDMLSNINLFKENINSFLPSCARETWEEVALAINCYLEWEYYDPASGICQFYLDTKKKIEDGTL